MTAEEHRLRDDLRTLAATEAGRRLLQLSLRSISRGDRGVTAGCWAERGIAGCVFQHAYWQGVEEGVFPDQGRPADWIGGLAGRDGYATMISTIDSFDKLARRQHSDVRRRLLRAPSYRIRHAEWRKVVERMLVETLAETEGLAAASRQQPASV